MLLHTPLWKRIAIWALIALAVVMATPNLFYARVETHNDAVTEMVKAAEAGQPVTPEMQAASEAWPSWLPSGLVNLGLDLRGGAHLLAEVKLEDVYKQRMAALWPEARDKLREIRDTVGPVRREPSPPDVLRIAISNPEGLPAAVEKLKELASNVITLTGVGATDINVVQDGQSIVISLSDAEKVATDTRTMEQSLEIIRRRVDAAGTREPSILRQGADRILIEVPGIGSAAELKAIIGTTAKLTFNHVVRQTTNPNEEPGLNNILLPDADNPAQFYVLDENPVVTGEELTNAQPEFDQNNRPAVGFKFDVTGARKFGEYTGANVGKPFAIVLDNEVISAPVINTAITGGSGIITGNFSIEESTNLAVLLRSGALPASMSFLEERTVGPELGQDSIDAGKLAGIIGLIVVASYMILSYGLFGLFANLALAVNLVILIAVLSMIGATLTLPGIAGIVLTMGMAVDANVLIYERVREELRDGKSPARALELGFERAFSAIMDSNVTGLITALIMFWIGSGPVRGFAVTTGIGIFTSMFTAVYVTRLIIWTYMNWRKPKEIVV